MVPLLDVRLPELRTFASGTEGLVPCAVACDAEVTGEKESENKRELRREEEGGRVCKYSELGERVRELETYM